MAIAAFSQASGPLTEHCTGNPKWLFATGSSWHYTGLPTVPASKTGRKSLLETTLSIIRCPLCVPSSELALDEGKWTTVQYANGAYRELKQGHLICPNCQTRFPVDDYVPSFAALLPDDIRSDASYWGHFYAQEVAAGNKSFLEPDLARRNRGACAYDPEEFLLQHPLLQRKGQCLDVGCGTGWTTLLLARHGFNAVGLEPAQESVVLAKRFAIEQGMPVDYICGAPGYVRFAEGSLDAIFAFHSLHHIPHLADVLASMRTWLRDGGVLAADEHVQSKPALWHWRKALQDLLQPGSTAATPAAQAPSANEDCSLYEVLPGIAHQFHIRDIRFRYIVFDSVCEWVAAPQECQEPLARLVRALQQSLSEWQPADAEYATVIAQKDAALPTAEQIKTLAAQLPEGLRPLLFSEGHLPSALGRSKRLARAWQIARREGFKALLREVAGYSYWRLSQ